MSPSRARPARWTQLVDRGRAAPVVAGDRPQQRVVARLPDRPKRARAAGARTGGASGPLRRPSRSVSPAASTASRQSRSSSWICVRERSGIVGCDQVWLPSACPASAEGAKEVRLALGPPADDQEGGTGVVALQDLHQGLGVPRIRAVVVGQRDRSLRVRDAADRSAVELRGRVLAVEPCEPGGTRRGADRGARAAPHRAALRASRRAWRSSRGALRAASRARSSIASSATEFPDCR